MPPFAPTLPGLYAFADALGVQLAPFQRRIARAAFGAEREVVAVLPRGNAKTTTAALIALHHLVSTPGASVSLGAVSREQASIAFQVMRQYAEHPALADRVEVRHMRLATDGGGVLRVLSGKGERAHGQTDSLMLLDEAWNLRDASLLEAFQTALVKRPDARLLVISTAASSLDSPLGRLRARALAGDATRTGSRIDATAPGLRWIEWSVPDDRPLSVPEVRRANPAPWITTAALSEQHARVSPFAWANFHACRWGVSEAAWLPVGAWQACRTDDPVDPDEPVYLGVDIGGTRAASAIVGVTADLHVAIVEVHQGDNAVLAVTDAVRRIATDRPVVEVAYDPWRFHGEALRLEAEGIGPLVAFPQSHARMTVASERLHSAIVERRLRHPAHPDLDRHVGQAVARQVAGRGWRLDKTDPAHQIDAVVALAMAAERAEHKPAPAQLVGWI